MKSYLVTAVLILMLAGCARQTIVLHTQAGETFHIPVKSLLFDNLATESKFTSGDMLYVSGWAPVNFKFTPPLHDSFVEKARKSIVASGESGQVDISVIKAGFWIAKNVADDIPIVGLFVVLRERGFRCDVDINVKTKFDSQRLTVSHEETRSTFLDDKEKVQQFVESCQNNLIRKVADLIKNSVSRDESSTHKIPPPS